MGNGVTHPHFGRVLDARNNVSHISGRETVARLLTQLEDTQLVDIVFLLGIDKLHKIALGNRAVQDLEIDNNAAE